MTNEGTIQITLQGDREVVLTRRFDAPRQRVFEALNTPEVVKRWFGSRVFTQRVCEIDVRVGGPWRYIIEGPDGREVAMHGVYLELDPPARWVRTEVFEDFAGAGDCVVTYVLEESGGATVFTSTVQTASPSVRTAMINAGMERGAAELYDRLAELLAKVP